MLMAAWARLRSRPPSERVTPFLVDVSRVSSRMKHMNAMAGISAWLSERRVLM